MTPVIFFQQHRRTFPYLLLNHRQPLCRQVVSRMFPEPEF